MSDKVCMNCRWWKRSIGRGLRGRTYPTRMGNCRRFPPAWAGNDARFPQTVEIESCGEWERRTND